MPTNALIAFDTSQAQSRLVSWNLEVGSPRFVGPVIEPNGIISPPVYLLVLLDVSGSMIGPGMAFTRGPLIAFIGNLPDRTVRVAVVPFGSRLVEGTIASGTFVPPSEARQRIEAIPPPERSANTALYSAVRAGAALLARQPPPAGGRVRRLLLVVTDGRNDVSGARDDPGLLGPDGLMPVREAVAEAGVEVFALGVGQGVLKPQLDSLAAGTGRAYISPLDPLRVADQLQAIRQQLTNRQQLTFASGSDVFWLGRLVRRVGLGVRVDEGSNEEVSLAWTPPLIALPAFSGVVREGAASPMMDVVEAVSGPPLERMVYVAIVSLFFLILWTLIPRWIWPATIMEASVMRERTDQIADEKAELSEMNSSGLLSAREAPPRDPTIVTGDHPIVR